MIQVALHGRIGGDPVSRATKNGTPMVTASMVVSCGRGEADSSEWFDLAAFNALADTLAKHAKGDMVSVHGTMMKRAFTDRQGQQRERWSVTLDSIVSARTVRPAGKKRGSSVKAPPPDVAHHFPRPDRDAETLRYGDYANALNDPLPF